MLLSQIESSLLEAEQLNGELSQMSVELQSSIELLAAWQGLINTLLLKNDFYNLKDLEKRTDDTAMGLFSHEQLRVNNRVVQVARYPVLIMRLYILPLLYGLLGAFAFVLRKLIDETHQLTYTRSSDTRFFLRIVLGSIAGLAIGFFFVSEPGVDNVYVTLTSLSPLALAFLAGYSVEFMFTAVDRLVNTILSDKGNKAEA